MRPKLNNITNLTSTYQDPVMSTATPAHLTQGQTLQGASQRGERVLLTEGGLNIFILQILQKHMAHEHIA